MPSDSDKTDVVEQLLDVPDLAGALESEQFRKFLDQVPIAIAVSDLGTEERVVYANPEFEKLTGRATGRFSYWTALSGIGIHRHKGWELAQAVVEESDFVGTFQLSRSDEISPIVDVYSNIIEDDGEIGRAHV